VQVWVCRHSIGYRFIGLQGKARAMPVPAAVFQLMEN
jgi:hypothetical protein